ncbi:MAG TPA: winged helix-turn-helix domain-containing protein, partial [Clostridia bacterium]|nr:winged helix-turn-helix domain-containing protein [Clostridia bacterium]
IQVDLESRAVTVDDQTVPLTPKEYDLLLFFARNAQQAFSRDALLDLVWGQSFDGTDRTVDSHVKSLRGKIKPYQDYIVTVWGYGYKFSP